MPGWLSAKSRWSAEQTHAASPELRRECGVCFAQLCRRDYQGLSKNRGAKLPAFGNEKALLLPLRLHLLVDAQPVGGDLYLRRPQVYLTSAYLVVQIVLHLIFLVKAGGRAG